MINIIGVRLGNTKRIYYFSPGRLQYKISDKVIVETERGLQFGEVATNIKEANEKDVFFPLKSIVRKATEKDVERNQLNIIDTEFVIEKTKKIVHEEKLPMKIVDASYTLNKDKLVLRFMSDKRVDFRQLVKILSNKFKTKIELRQIGIRDKAKEVGGLGPCGRSLCCTEFLHDFEAISINMAKNQNLALNPSKINGACGRLLCCLAYEDDIYAENRKNLPKIGENISVGKTTGRVVELDVLNNGYKVRTNDNEIIYISVKF